MITSSRIILSLLLIVLAGSLARADLHFEQPIADANEVRAGTPLVHRFAFVNDGKEPADITETRTSCGCLKPSVDRRNVKPGERGVVTLEVNTLAASAGPHTWHVYVSYCCGGVNYEMDLQLKAQVITEVNVQPASVTVFAESAVGHEIILTDLRDHPLNITSLGSTSPKLRTHLGVGATDTQGHPIRRIELAVAPDYPEGRHEEVVDIYTDDPLYRDLRVPVTIVKRSGHRITATPPEVNLVAAPGQEVPSKVICVRSGDQANVTVDRVESGDAAVVCQWAQGPAAMATVRVKVDRTRMTGNRLETKIRIHVAAPSEAMLTVPVLCVLE